MVEITTLTSFRKYYVLKHYINIIYVVVFSRMVHGARCINLNFENYVRKSVLKFTVYLFVYSYAVRIYILFIANFGPNKFASAPSHRTNRHVKGDVSSSPLPPLTVELWYSLKKIKHAFPRKLSRVILSNCVLKYMPPS